MTEIVGSSQRGFESFCHLGSESKAETEAMIFVGGNDSISSVFEKQPTVEGEVNHGSHIQRLTNLQVVSVEEMRPFTDIHREQTIVVAEGGRNAVF